DAAAHELWRVTRSVCRGALKTIGIEGSDPPSGWLIHQRWKETGHCPMHGTELKHATIAGRTTAWCPRCQTRADAEDRLPSPHCSQRISFSTGSGDFCAD
ncbi:MAG TPA: hypothetical protein VF077_06010, partial [Nitrospiraceae bacterium]